MARSSRLPSSGKTTYSCGPPVRIWGGLPTLNINPSAFKSSRNNGLTLRTFSLRADPLCALIHLYFPRFGSPSVAACTMLQKWKRAVKPQWDQKISQPRKAPQSLAKVSLSSHLWTILIISS